jgi:hypothetical protein
VIHDNDSEFAKTLSKTIADESEGVFLWARFALDEIRNGHTQSLRLDEIQDNLRQLPKEMTDVYRRVIAKMSESTKRRAGLYLALQVTFQDIEYPFLRFPKFDRHYNKGGVSTREFIAALRLLESQSAKVRPIRELADINSDDIKNYTRRISHFGGGLLEVVSMRDLDSIPFKRGSFVKIIHRTVLTYLESAGRMEGPVRKLRQSK